MKFYLHEKLKFVFLMLLVLLSLFQVGILWDYQNHGLPISFFNGVVANDIVEKNYDLKEFLKPSRIVMSQGYDEPHLVINPYDKEFEYIWDEARSYLRDIILENKILSKIPYNDDDWGDLVVKKSIAINFSTTIDAKLIKFFLGVENNSDLDFGKPNKMLISFEDNLSSEIMVYMTDGETICKYSIKPHLKSEGNVDLSKMENNFEGSDDSTAYWYWEKYPPTNKPPVKLRPDIPVYLTGDKYNDYSNLQVEMPQLLKADTRIVKNQESIAQWILGNDRVSYDVDVDNEGAMVFGNINNIYKLDTKGFLDYIYLGSQSDSSKADIAITFEKCISFIASKKKLIKIEDISLSKINYDQKKESYIFEFNYNIGSIPILIHDKEIGPIQSCVKIEANNSRVLSTRIILRDFKFKDVKKSYNLNFVKFSKEIFSKNEFKKTTIEDIFVGFYLDENMQEGEFSPLGIVKTNGNNYFGLNLPERKGE